MVDTKSLQLCAQARRALEVAIGAECRDEALLDLVLVDVVPDPTVRGLVAARGFLRAQVAAAIHRKHTPELVFELIRGVGRAEGRTT